MELFRNLRIRAGESLLKGKMAKNVRRPYYSSFVNIKTIGIIWDASSTGHFSTLTRFHQKMAELGKAVKIIGYFPGKVLPDVYIANRLLTCIKRTEVDFLYRPRTPEAESFIKEKFDVLIDLNFESVFTLKYILENSLASFKVGLAGPLPESSPFDLMISMKEPVNTEKYLEQVSYYLEMINSETIKQAV